MTTIYALNDCGFYLGAVQITDPLASVPRGVSTPPPDLLAGQRARWSGAWEVLEEAPDDGIAALKTELTAKATELRWQYETGGITLPGGIQVATGTDDQNRITTVITNAQLAGVTSVDFKAASGWVTLTLEQVQGIAAAIARHVQACFPLNGHTTKPYLHWKDCRRCKPMTCMRDGPSSYQVLSFK